jgi:hypothetical protein
MSQIINEKYEVKTCEVNKNKWYTKMYRKIEGNPRYIGYK